MTEKAENPIVVMTAFEERRHAEEVVEILLQKRLIACGQILGPVTSSYFWNDDIARTSEFVLTMKSMERLYQQLEDTIRAHHPYQVPEIIAIPVVRISADYRQWMIDELAK